MKLLSKSHINFNLPFCVFRLSVQIWIISIWAFQKTCHQLLDNQSYEDMGSCWNLLKIKSFAHIKVTIFIMTILRILYQVLEVWLEELVNQNKNTRNTHLKHNFISFRPNVHEAEFLNGEILMTLVSCKQRTFSRKLGNPIILKHRNKREWI